MDKLAILFLAANPQDTSRLRLDEEIRTIQERIRASKHAATIQLIPELAVRRADLSDALLRHKPHIVHFSGHGTSSGQLYLEDERGLKQPVAASAILIIPPPPDDLRVQSPISMGKRLHQTIIKFWLLNPF